LKSDRKRNKEKVGGCAVAGAWNHVKENTTVSPVGIETPNYGYKDSVYKVHIFIYVYIYIFIYMYLMAKPMKSAI
jgi:hypothetical protein